MKEGKILTIVKEHGALDYDRVNRILAVWLDSIRNGKYFLTLKQVKEKRSSPQNRLMWLWFAIIAEEWSKDGRGYTSQDVHDYYALEFLPKDTPKGKIGGNTSALSTDEFSIFLEKVEADVAQEGMILPHPEDRYVEELEELYHIK